VITGLPQRVIVIVVVVFVMTVMMVVMLRMVMMGATPNALGLAQ